MRYVIFYARPIVFGVLLVLAGGALAPRLGVAWTLVLAAALGTALALLGGALLKTSAVGHITWKNRVAGYCIPWGWKFAGGKLGRAQAISASLFLVLTGLGAALASSPAASGIVLGTPRVTGGLLLAAWIVDGAALLYLVSSLFQNYSLGSSQARSMFKPISLVVLILGVSITLFFLGHPMAALLVGGGPPLLMLGVVGFLLLVMLTAGRNVRWN